MIIHSDWHIHSEASYDSTLTLDEIANTSEKNDFKYVGITDHVNFNDRSFLNDINRSATIVKEFQAKHPNFVLGVELTPVAKPEFDYISKSGTREGFNPPILSKPFDIELALSKEQMKELGIRYAIGASHWRVDLPYEKKLQLEKDGCIKEWFRQQMWLACDNRITVLGHPWYNGEHLWYEDFDIIPQSMNNELASAVKENGKYVECNSHFFCTQTATEKFRYQYAEFLKELNEMGIPITYGSDSHNKYSNAHVTTEKYLSEVGFRDGDIVEISKSDLW